ncbi:NAD(P)H-quinone oxidoreductase [Aurantiacibacter xanthus]|uniref:NAD(P)H-quinone oxidoreductase n=2 Tax=Aurantiacibacter xanthus TaxID=1784712 RepID=A0A3A1PEZ9_9SPHN|nr:NAD(P)H-quinone oxidoreductase [Aurantiacibacter xanthus]RIV92363.1 NAD(P)H-quinone oxidoreductase [Aurantiacibacter xanthus]
MAAITISEPGGPEVLALADQPVPVPGPGEVLVKVAYAGVNRPDCLQRAGLYPPPPGASALPGLEISGTIVGAGDAEAADWLGRRVCALVSGGGYAQYCVAKLGTCLPVPDALPLEQAAALPETLFTVWHNVFQRGLARDGETLLVHGGTSGIGSMAIKLAKLFALTVIVTCGSDDKCVAARELGADHAINYKTADFVEEVRAITGKAGCQIVLDMVAGSYTQRNLDCLGEEGRLVTIAVLGGAKAEVNMARLMVRRQTMTGSTLRARSDAFKQLLAAEIACEVWPLVEEGDLRPQMDRVFPLAEAAEAHRRMEAGDHIGKIVLAVD